MRFAIYGLMIAAVSSAACGKKGPPLAPIVRIPAVVEAISARRVGSDVYITLTIPSANIDGSMPADVERVNLYGYTGAAAPPRTRFVEMASLVASVPVMSSGAEAGEPSPDPSAAGAPQGTSATVRDRLEDDELIATPPAPETAAQASSSAAASGVRRFYMAIAFSDRGRPGPPGTIAEFPLMRPPDPPARVETSYTSDQMTVSWEPSGGLLGFLVGRALPLEVPPFDVAPVPAAGAASTAGSEPARYNVYREIAPDPLADPVVRNEVPAWQATPPTPINNAPLAALTFAEPLTFDQRERCYRVTAVRGTGGAAVEGDPSPRACVTAVDIFPPAAPAGLVTTVDAGGIRLIWEANSEDDLAGYVVLRAEAGGATLTPISGETAISETRFTDDTVMPGLRYVYEVIAVDSRVPLPNRSAPARIEETAR